MTLMPTNTPTIAPTVDEGCFVLKLGDSWGDGWNGAIWTWRHAVPEGEMRGSEIATGTLQDGDSGTQYLPCYNGRVPIYTQGAGPTPLLPGRLNYSPIQSTVIMKRTFS